MSELSLAAKKYFHLKEGASDDDYVAYNFMILAAKAKDGVDKLVPAIVHADNSSRLQVVRENNDLFVESVENFDSQTGFFDIIITYNDNSGIEFEPKTKSTLEAIYLTLFVLRSTISYEFLPVGFHVYFISNKLIKKSFVKTPTLLVNTPLSFADS